MNQQKIGQFIKQLRIEKKLTQAQLAEILGVSDRSVSRWENSVNMPDLDLLILIAKYFDVEIDELLNGERKSENMDMKNEETLLKVADYSSIEKECYSKKIRIAFIAALAGMFVYMCIDIAGLADVQPYESIVNAAMGLVVGTLITGLLYSSRYIAKIRAAKLRLFKRGSSIKNNNG